MGSEARGARRASHLLVISDIHLGEYSKEVSRIEYLKTFSRGDEDLCAFLEYHQERWIDNTPWRLVINGDFLDFIAVTFTPGDQEDGLTLSEEEEQWGLDTTEEKAVWKLRRIMSRHFRFFAYLADFVGRGNSVEVLHGNHDSELWWPGVHEEMRKRLREIYFGGEHVGGADPEEFEARVLFHPWFLYEPGKFYIEHGNQYDDFSSFRYRLNPVAPYDTAQLAMPVSHMAIRYFVNQYRGFRSHDKDNWTLLDYLRWLREQGLDNVVRILKLYVVLSGRLLSYADQSRSVESEALREAHLRSLAAVADKYGMDREAAAKLDTLVNLPVTDSLGRTMQALGFDLYVVSLFWLGLAYLSCALPLSWVWTLALWAVVAVGALGSRWALPWIRDRFMGGYVTTTVAPKVDQAAGRIAEILGVRYVIFGHTHKPKKLKVRSAPDGWYINSGSWLAPRRRERHTVRGGKEVCPSRLTFIVYRDGSVPDARLFRWCSRNGRPVPFDPKVGLEQLAPERVERGGPKPTRAPGSRASGLRPRMTSSRRRRGRDPRRRS